LDELSEQIDALTGDTERWLPEDMTFAGAVVGIGYDGSLAVERGLVKPEDEPEEPATGPQPTVGKGNGLPGLSDKLAVDLTAHRTAALREMVAGNAGIALVAVVHALALPLFFPHEADTCLELSLRSTALDSSAEGIDGSTAAIKLAERHQFWRRQLPKEADALWDWLLAQESQTRLDLLAYCAGQSVNAVRKRHERAGTDRLAHADRLATTLGLDMTQWWQPTAESYFRHVPKAAILETVREAVTPEAAENLAKLKKDALAAEAERRLSGTGWLPMILRVPTSPEADAVAMAAE
jgi:ParB family chromosome partitioning protein